MGGKKPHYVKPVSREKIAYGLDLTDAIISVGDDLRRNRILWYHLPVDEMSAQLLCQRLLALDLSSVEIIKLFISSDGGSDYDMWTIIDMMKWIRSPVHTYAFGICASAATGIFASGSKRYVFPNTQFMFHLGEGDYGSQDYKGQKEAAKHQKDLEDRYLKLISQITGKKPPTLEEEFRKHGGDLYLNADQALKFKIADEIIEGKRPASLKRRKRRKKR
jgi:ATP-dependent Clp protease protease subunit